MKSVNHVPTIKCKLCPGKYIGTLRMWLLLMRKVKPSLVRYGSLGSLYKGGSAPRYVVARLSQRSVAIAR